MSREAMNQALNRVAKWRMLLTGWQLGTRPKGDPEGDAVRDHREATLMLRVDVTALTHLLISKGLVTEEEYFDAVVLAAQDLDDVYSKRFPGVRTTDDGLVMDQRVAEWMENWRP